MDDFVTVEVILSGTFGQKTDKQEVIDEVDDLQITTSSFCSLTVLILTFVLQLCQSTTLSVWASSNFLSCPIEGSKFKEGIFLNKIIHSKHFVFFYIFLNKLQVVNNWVRLGWHTRASIFCRKKKRTYTWGFLWIKTRKVLSFVKKQKYPLKSNNSSCLCLLYRKANNTRPEWDLWWSECVYCDWFTLEIL